MKGQLINAEDERAAEWLRGVSHRDMEALEALFDLYNRPLYRIVLKMLNDPSDAEEVTQDTFVKVWTSSFQYDSKKGRPFSFLVIIARRLAIDKLRQKSRKVPLFNGEQSDFVIDQNQLVQNESRNGNTSDMEWINEQLSELPKGQWDAIDLAFRQGLTHKEIAHKLKTPLGTIKSDIRRGLERLRDIYLKKTDD